MLAAVGAENAVNMFVLALAKQMQIEVTYRKPKGAANAARLVGEGWLQEWGAEMNLGAKMTATLTVKFTGLLNVVKAA